MSTAEIDVDSLLKNLSPDTVSGTVPAPRPQIAKVRYTHDAMIDMIIAEPWVSQNELARRFGYSASWICTVLSSDAFQARMAERTKELRDPIIIASMDTQFRALAARSLEILQEKLNKPSDQVPDNLALKALELSSKAAGYGASPSGPAVNMHLHLEDLGKNLVNTLRRAKDDTPLEGQFSAISSG